MDIKRYQTQDHAVLKILRLLLLHLQSFTIFKQKNLVWLSLIIKKCFFLALHIWYLFCGYLLLLSLMIRILVFVKLKISPRCIWRNSLGITTVLLITMCSFFVNVFNWPYRVFPRPPWTCVICLSKLISYTLFVNILICTKMTCFHLCGQSR